MASLSSAPSAVDTETLTLTDWWLKDPLAPAGNIVVLPEGPELEITYPEEAAAFSPLGRSRKVVVGSAEKGAEFALTLFFATRVAYDALAALRALRRTLLLQSPSGDNWYVRIVSVGLRRGLGGQRRAVVAFVEVDAP